MTKPRASTRGFALVFAFVFFTTATLLLAALFSMVSTSSRLAAIYMGRSRCRLAAQSSIEWAKSQIQTAFTRHTGGSSSVRIGPKTSTAYAWFNTTAGSRTIGTGSHTFILPASTNLSGCTLKMRFGPSGQISNSSSAIVSLIVLASCVNPNGSVSEVAVEERFRFGVGRSRVFDFAYFVNNYGWFQGSACTANGDVCANGDMYLDANCKINGDVYAAQNEELNVRGAINNTGTMDTRSDYWSSSRTSTRSRPTSPTHNEGDEWVGGYNAPVSAGRNNLDMNAALAARTHAYGEVGITMPWIGDLTQYVEWANEERGSISGGLRYTMNEDGTVAKNNNVTINAHYSGAGPSGDATLSDRGALVLEGTSSNPITVNGPVVVDSDVVIKGYVTGQGTIYSGRNIHIVGDVKYVHPPSWNHPDTNPQATAKANSTKDLFGLAAKGNIVFGDSTNDSTFQTGDATWYNQESGLKNYLSKEPYVQKYICDNSDKNIGYPRSIAYGYTTDERRFCGDYTAVDGGNRVVQQTKQVLETTGTGRNKQTKYVDKLVNVDKKDRRYYHSVVQKEILNAIKSDTLITQIDGVLYNNHGIFGKIGSCTINGALICRNEGILYSKYLNINWDIRLREDSAEGIDNKAGMPVGASPPGVVSWHEVPVSIVANYFQN